MTKKATINKPYNRQKKVFYILLLLLINNHKKCENLFDVYVVLYSFLLAGENYEYNIAMIDTKIG